MSVRARRATGPVPPLAPVDVVAAPPGRGGATAWLIAGSLVSGLSGYVYQVLGARVLGEEEFAPLGLLWTVQYLVIAVALVPVESWTARQRALGRGDGGRTTVAPRVLVVWAMVLAVVVGTVALLSPEHVVGGERQLAPTLPVAVLSYALFMGLRGCLAGDLRFADYGRLTLLEGVARCVLVVLAALLVPSTTAFGWVLPLGPVLACALWWSASRLAAAAPSGDGPVAPAVDLAPATGAAGFLGWSTAANGLAQTLLLASPLLLVPFGAEPAEIAIFFVTMTAARVPLVLAYNGMLSRVLTAMTRATALGKSLSRVVMGVTGGTLVSGLVAAGLGWLLGPALLAFAFGQDFRPPGWLAALAGAGAVLATGAQVVNQALIAQGRVRRTVAPWAVALAVAVAVAAAGGAWSATARAATAFVAGEVTALLVLALAAGLTGRQVLARPANGVDAASRVVA